MNSRKAAAVAMSIIAIACRICGIFMSAMTVLLCFSGLTAKLQIVGFVVELSRALPSAIAGYGVITSPFGGVFRSRVPRAASARGAPCPAATS